MLVSPDDIINCYKECCSDAWECADFLGITEKDFINAVIAYSKEYEFGMEHGKYKIKFRDNGTVLVWDFFN